MGCEFMNNYDKDIEENPYLGEFGKYVQQFARNNNISVSESYQHPTVKAYKDSLNHLNGCFNLLNLQNRGDE